MLLCKLFGNRVDVSVNVGVRTADCGRAHCRLYSSTLGVKLRLQIMGKIQTEK